MSLGKQDIPLSTDDDSTITGQASAKGGQKGSNNTTSGSGSSAPPPYTPPVAEDDSNFHTDTDQALLISASDLLANDTAARGQTLQLIRVFDAVNGTVTLEGDIITFTPDEGYMGPASFSYEIVDERGRTDTAVVEVQVETPDPACDCGDPASGGGHDSGDGTVHTDDPAKMAEHMAVMALVPVAEATHVAINNGSWFDPATWANGEVPGEGARVLIPDGISVQYDGESDVSLFTVRVDGSLEFATDVNTFMEVDTFVVTGTGHLTMGTLDNPISPDVKAIIQFADNGPIDVAWDPLLLSRGLLSHGHVEITGAEKDSFLRVAVDPMAGDTSITLEEIPDGWQVGDKIVIAGTHQTEVTNNGAGELRDITTEDEELVITRIEGNVVYFDKPLEYDHEGARDDLKTYVANMSRNVVFQSENADDIPVYQRGHTMFMHSDDVDIRYAEFYELGRTDKSERAFDVLDLDTVEYDTNIKTRYPLHIHRAGVSDLDNPVMLVGNAVWGSPGWGIVHHDSNAIIADNAVYDVFGASYVAETGNETGRWVHNIAIRSLGVGGGPKFHEDVDANDVGRTGAGFWFSGRLVDVVDNVAASIPGGQGFVYMSRGTDLIDVQTQDAQLPESLRYLDEVMVNKPAISQFIGNEVFASGTGLMVIKANPTQGHDVRSIIEDFTAWEVRMGVHLQYTAHYTLIDLDLLATDGSSGGDPGRFGIEIDNSALDIVVNGANIDGFDTGIRLDKGLSAVHDFSGDYGFVFIDVMFANVGTQWENRDAGDLILKGDDLNLGALSFDSDLDGFPLAPKNNTFPSLELSGVKTDSIGMVEVSSDWDPHTIMRINVRGAVEQEGYWLLPDGRQITALDQYITDRATGEIIKVANFVEFVNEIDGSFVRIDPVYHGIYDFTNEAPVARTDFASVEKNGSIVIDVLANDFDPDGDSINVDGYIDAKHGQAYDNGDGTFTYVPDPNYTGDDEFWYWVEDEFGNLAKAHVQVTVEI